MHKLLALFVIIFFVLLIPVIVARTQQSTETRQHAAGQTLGVHVVGNQLVNTSGQAIRLIGLNRIAGYCVKSTPAQSIIYGPSDAAAVAAMASWHINVVRITLNEDCWLGINNAPAQFSGNIYQSTIMNFITLAHS